MSISLTSGVGLLLQSRAGETVVDPSARVAAAVAVQSQAQPPQSQDALTTFSAAVAAGLPLTAILAAQAGMGSLTEPPMPKRMVRVQPVEKSERS